MASVLTAASSLVRRSRFERLGLELLELAAQGRERAFVCRAQLRELFLVSDAQAVGRRDHRGFCNFDRGALLLFELRGLVRALLVEPQALGGPLRARVVEVLRDFIRAARRRRTLAALEL
jgi:hypothetical protein